MNDYDSARRMGDSMTKRERVHAALHGEEVDRVPVAAWRHFPGHDYTAEAQVESFITFQEKYDWDFMKLMFRNSFPLEDWGGTVKEIQEPYGYYLPEKYAIGSTDEWQTLEVLDPRQGTLNEMVEVVRSVAEKMQNDLYKLATVFCPLMTARQLAGDEQLLRDLRENPQVLHGALEVITETTMRFQEALLRNGADGVFFATKSNTPDFMSREEYSEFGHPYNLKVLAALEDRSRFTMLHVCQKNPRFDEFADYPVHAINWDDRITPPSLAEAKSKTDKCLIGGIDKEGTLRNGTATDVEQQVQDAIDSAGKTKLIVGPGCGIPVDVSDKNLLAMRRAANRE
jgi:uroporphyrinogen decarboxylase